MLLSVKDLFSLDRGGQRHQLPLAGTLPPPRWRPGLLATITVTAPARVCSLPCSGLGLTARDHSARRSR